LARARRTAPGPRGGSPVASGTARLSSDYGALRAEALQCTRCDLSRTRTRVVFSDGNPSARLIVVGEAPGAREDETGMAFVGPAGKFLDLLLACVGLSRESTAYICNVLKCRPPGNRNPLPGEIEACTPFLKRQIALISPDALLAVGAFAAQFLTGKDSAIGKLRGKVYSYEGVPLVVTYHPAALLRNASLTRPTWDDFQLLRQVMDGA
jgi:uracil-DNA glycosylase family 4